MLTFIDESPKSRKKNGHKAHHHVQVPRNQNRPIGATLLRSSAKLPLPGYFGYLIMGRTNRRLL
ncbi:MAG TPA: hypothetical protein DCY52_09850 [Methylococcaceae bacterium]|nr:hypothetical protein [Methylococcaceae bacterium]